VVQCGAVCCSVSQCADVDVNAAITKVAVCYSVLQCVAVCCGVLQCVDVDVMSKASLHQVAICTRR